MECTATNEWKRACCHLKMPSKVMRFSRGSIHLPISTPLWWEAIYTDRSVSGEEKSGRLKKDFKLWEMSGVGWQRRMDGWRESTERRGRRDERKERGLEGKAGHRRGCSTEIGWSVSYCGPAVWGCRRRRTLSATKHCLAVIVALYFFSYLEKIGKHTDIESFCQKKSIWKLFFPWRLAPKVCFFCCQDSRRLMQAP